MKGMIFMPAHKNQKRSTWYASFYYEDWNGKRKKKKKEGFKTKREALQFEREFLETAQANPNMKFESLVKLYLEDRKARMKPTTYTQRGYVIALRILPYFKDMPINSIEPATVRQWQSSIISSGNNYSQTYLMFLSNQLSAIFNFAMKYYKLPSNPARIAGSMGRKRANVMKFWTKAEYDLFIATLSKKPLSKITFELLFWTGIRIGELQALTLDDFDFREQTLTINKNYARLKGEDLILEPKTPKSRRSISLHRSLCSDVQEYITLLYDYQPNDRLFLITKQVLYDDIKRGCRKTDIKKIRLHDLRHSHASLLIEMGFAPLLISERLGHESIETTLQTYSHLYPNKQEEVSRQLQILTEET
jgi:integrase